MKKVQHDNFPQRALHGVGEIVPGGRTRSAIGNRRVGATALLALAVLGGGGRELVSYGRNHEQAITIPSLSEPHKLFSFGDSVKLTWSDSSKDADSDGSIHGSETPTTLWQVAELAYPDKDPRDIVDALAPQVIAQNEQFTSQGDGPVADTSAFQAGDTLVLPMDAQIGAVVEPDAHVS